MATPASTAAPTPDSSPAPVATPVPVATPSATVTPDSIDFAAYNQARTPTVSITLTPAKPSTGIATQLQGIKNVGSPQTSTQAPSTPAPQPVTGGSVYNTINLGVINRNTPPPAAAVTLQFDPARAGTLIWVQTLDGGTLQAQDADGKLITVEGGFWMEISTLGRVSFTFQAPTASARYQVLIRLDNVSSFLPFVVPDPTADS